MDYQRFVSYLYEYRQGIRQKNTGFVKIDCRGEQCKVNIRMKLSADVVAEELEANFFYRQGAALFGIPFAVQSATQYQCEIRKVLPLSFFEKYGKQLQEMSGVYISCGDDGKLAFVSAWDDEPVRVEGIQRAKDRSAQMMLQMSDEVRAASLDTDGVEEVQAEAEIVNAKTETLPSKPESVQIEEEVPQESTEVLQIEEQVSQVAAETQREKESQMVEEETPHADLQITDIQKSREELDEKSEDDIENQLKKEWQGLAEAEFSSKENASSEAPSTWERMEKNFTKFLLPAENGNLECIRMKPHHLALLPRQYWNYGNNSFLLQGFYSYQYIILAKKGADSTGDSDIYYLGVPGRRRDRERMMASLYGFTEFIPARSRQQNFGFWCMPLEFSESEQR